MRNSCGSGAAFDIELLLVLVYCLSRDVLHISIMLCQKVTWKSRIAGPTALSSRRNWKIYPDRHRDGKLVTWMDEGFSPDTTESIFLEIISSTFLSYKRRRRPCSVVGRGWSVGSGGVFDRSKFNVQRSTPNVQHSQWHNCIGCRCPEDSLSYIDWITRYYSLDYRFGASLLGGCQVINELTSELDGNCLYLFKCSQFF